MNYMDNWAHRNDIYRYTLCILIINVTYDSIFASVLF